MIFVAIKKTRRCRRVFLRYRKRRGDQSIVAVLFGGICALDLRPGAAGGM